MFRLLAGAGFFAAFLAWGLWLPAFSPAQQGQGKKPRVVEEEDDKKPKKTKPVEEEVDPGAKQKRKVIRVDDEDAPKKPSKPTESSDSITGSIAEILKTTKHPGIKDLCQKLLKPHDSVVCQYSTSKNQETVQVQPLPRHYGRAPKLDRFLSVVPYDQNWQLSEKKRELAPNIIKEVLSYEEKAIDLVDGFLQEHWETLPRDSKSYLSRRDALAFARHILSEVGNWHSAARSTEQREGDEWDSVQEALQKKLLEIREKQLDDFLQANDWDAAADLAGDISRRHPEKTVQERIAKRLATYIEVEIPRGGLTTEKLKEVRLRLSQLEAQFPGSPAAETIGKTLQQQAESLFKQGKELIANNQNQRGLELLKQALDLWPQLPELQTYYLRQTAAYPILRVGVRNMPTYMAPGVAWTESEREAVELLFESLVKQLPEYIAGSQNVADRYVPGLAESMPEQSAQLVRTFQLPRETVWLGPDKALPLSGSDVRNSARLLGNDKRPGYNRPLGEMIEDVKTGGDDRHVNVTLQHGFLDPYSLLTFKILPDQAAGKDYKDGFARQPIGSGPYRLDGIRTIDNEQRMVFLANPYYSARPGRQGLPRIREIHFVVTPDPSDALSKSKVDLLLPEVVRDLGADKLEALRSSAKAVGPLPTRRIYFLAINHSKPIFQGDKGTAVRRAIAYAIPRMEILAKGLGLPGDQPLNGPYPPGSWASDPKIKTLDNPDIARGLKAEVQSNPAAKNPIKLLYPKEDKRLDAAMEIIRDRLDQTLGLKVELVAADSRELHDQVEVSHAYDLAYYHYDFPSEAYWLWPLFYPEDNYLRYFRDGTLDGMFRRSMARRDFAEVRRLTHDIHNYITQKMLIVPLWQLAGYYAIRDGYETGPVDPLAVLGNVEQWRPRK